MPKIVNKLNPFGEWLSIELNKRKLSKSAFAERLGKRQSMLSSVMYRSNAMDSTILWWRHMCEKALEEYDKEAGK